MRRLYRDSVLPEWADRVLRSERCDANETGLSESRPGAGHRSCVVWSRRFEFAGLGSKAFLLGCRGEFPDAGASIGCFAPSPHAGAFLRLLFLSTIVWMDGEDHRCPGRPLWLSSQLPLDVAIMAKKSRRNVSRRSATYRPESCRPRAFVLRPGVEDLEVRRLLAVTINEFGGSSPVINPAGITTGPDSNLWFTEANPSPCRRSARSPPSWARQTTLFSESALRRRARRGSRAAPTAPLWFTESDKTNKIGTIDDVGRHHHRIQLPSRPRTARPTRSPRAPTAPSGSPNTTAT